jgi:hypothetical protein
MLSNRGCLRPPRGWTTQLWLGGRSDKHVSAGDDDESVQNSFFCLVQGAAREGIGAAMDSNKTDVYISIYIDVYMYIIQAPSSVYLVAATYMSISLVHAIIHSHPIVRTTPVFFSIGSKLRSSMAGLPVAEPASPLDTTAAALGSASQSIECPAKQSTPQVSSRDWVAYFQNEISLDHADVPIVLCCLVSGLCDSSAYNAWTCFVSMQTGSLIILPTLPTTRNASSACDHDGRITDT